MSFIAGLIALLVLGGIVTGGIVVFRRVIGKRDETSSDGGDVIAYLLLALAVGVAAFALAELGRAAFPGESFVFDANTRVATSLASLVVASPIAVFLWRRQAERRERFPHSAGWTVYLALMEAVFMTAVVISGFAILDWAIGEGDAPTWTDLVVFGSIVALHEIASRRTLPGPDGGELPRVVGAAVGLIPTSIAIGGILFWLFQRVYATVAASAGGPDIGTWVALLLVAAPIWWYRWWRPWPQEAGIPRHVWLFLTSVGALSTTLGAVVLIAIQTLLYLLTDTAPAGSHFEFLPAAASVGVVAVLVWAHHRRLLGPGRTDPLRAYEYTMSAIGLAVAIGSASALSAMAFGRSDLIRPDAETTIITTSLLLSALGIWLSFWLRCTAAPRAEEAATAPRRFYLIGFAVITGLTSAGALIGTLVVIFQRLLDAGGTDTLALQASLFVFAGLATWHLLRINAQDRDLIGSPEVLTPFQVTIICSHPGMIATQFPKEAKLRVVYRGDDAGPISEEMGSAIVDAVGNTSSLVWVDAEGFRVAPAR